MSTDQTKQRFLIEDKHLKNPTLSNRKLAKSLKISRKTVDTVLKRFTEQKTIQRKQGSGRKKRTANPRALERLETSLEEHPDWSDRYRAKKLKVSNFFVHKWRLRLGYQSFKVVKMPNRNDKQNSTAKSRARKLNFLIFCCYSLLYKKLILLKYINMQDYLSFYKCEINYALKECFQTFFWFFFIYFLYFLHGPYYPHKGVIRPN